MQSRFASGALQCSLCVALAIDWAVGASVHLRATVATSVARSANKYVAGSACQFVAHRPDDSEEVLTAGGPQVLFQKGEVVVLEKSPMRYLVSLAGDGSCNEQAEQVCSTTASGNGTAATCDSSPCTPEGNGDTMLSYLRSMAGGALAGRPPPGRSAVVGLGSGALAAWLSNAFPDGQVDAVDLSADVVAAAPCFGVRESSQLHLIQDEGRHFLLGAPAFAYDAIFLDAFDAAGSVPPCLATAEFFQNLTQKLSPDQGVLAVNLGARDDPGPVLAAIRKAFMHVAVGKAPKLTNHLVLASQTELTVSFGDAGPAELLSPGSVAANLTRWARQGGYHLEASQAGTVTEVPKTDAAEGCAAVTSSA